MVRAWMSSTGKASGQREYQSIHVKQHWYPCEEGRGPTKSMWICSNLLDGGANVPTGEETFLETFDFWHAMHPLAHFRQSVLIEGQTKRCVKSFTEAFIPGCEIWWSDSKAVLRNDFVMNGRIVYVDTSQNRVMFVSGSVTFFNCKPVPGRRYAWSSSSSTCDFAKATKAIPTVNSSTRDSVSATMLSLPATCRMSVVN